MRPKTDHEASRGNSALFIDDEIKQSATRCQRAHACLSRPEENLCKVISTLNNGQVFVNCLSELGCPYQHSCEGRTLCTCPVRSEVYKKYNI